MQQRDDDSTRWAGTCDVGRASCVPVDGLGPPGEQHSTATALQNSCVKLEEKREMQEQRNGG